MRRLTRKQLLRRIFQSRRERLQTWRSEMQAQRSMRRRTQAVGSRWKSGRDIGCMAGYNGERYITAQLHSILIQLGAKDEVIVVDDASTDGTKEKCFPLGDSRIQLIEHTANRGVSRTFEDAIRAASGRILFLSDQDDLWSPNKVAVMMEAFRSHPDVTLIATDVSLIDWRWLPPASQFQASRKFRPGLWANVVRNRFGGCTMAFRCEVIGDICPPAQIRRASRHLDWYKKFVGRPQDPLYPGSSGVEQTACHDGNRKKDINPSAQDSNPGPLAPGPG